MKINVVIANTRKESSRIANAGVDTGANMLGVGAPPVAAAISWFPSPSPSFSPSGARVSTVLSPPFGRSRGVSSRDPPVLVDPRSLRQASSSSVFPLDRPDPTLSNVLRSLAPIAEEAQQEEKEVDEVEIED
jgi:hypothetical protein